MEDLVSKELVFNFIRNKAESIEKEIDKINNKIMKIMDGKNIYELDKIEKLNRQRELLQAQQNILYMTIGNMNELEALKSGVKYYE